MRGAGVLLRLPAGHPGRAQLAAGAHARAVHAAERQRHACEPACMLAVRHVALRVRMAKPLTRFPASGDGHLALFSVGPSMSNDAEYA